MAAGASKFNSRCDHAGLHIQLTSTEKGTTPFKFFNSWLRDARFNTTFWEAWNKTMEGSPIYILQQKIKEVRNVGKNWAREIRLETETPLMIAAELQVEATKLQADLLNPTLQKK